MRRLAGDEEKPNPEDLAHFGIPGMKWGVVNKDKSAGPSNRELNKKFRTDQRAVRNAQIDKARADFKANGRKDFLEAKKQYKIDKTTMGTAAARAKLDAVRQKNLSTVEVANQVKSGKETALHILAVVGLAGVGILANVARRR